MQLIVSGWFLALFFSTFCWSFNESELLHKYDRPSAVLKETAEFFKKVQQNFFPLLQHFPSSFEVEDKESYIKARLSYFYPLKIQPLTYPQFILQELIKSWKELISAKDPWSMKMLETAHKEVKINHLHGLIFPFSIFLEEQGYTIFSSEEVKKTPPPKRKRQEGSADMSNLLKNLQSKNIRGKINLAIQEYSQRQKDYFLKLRNNLKNISSIFGWVADEEVRWREEDLLLKSFGELSKCLPISRKYQEDEIWKTSICLEYTLRGTTIFLLTGEEEQKRENIQNALKEATSRMKKRINVGQYPVPELYRAYEDLVKRAFTIEELSRQSTIYLLALLLRKKFEREYVEVVPPTSHLKKVLEVTCQFKEMFFKTILEQRE